MRLAFLELASTILLKCHKTLNVCVRILIDVVIFYSGDDEVPKVRDLSRDTLDAVAAAAAGHGDSGDKNIDDTKMTTNSTDNNKTLAEDLKHALTTGLDHSLTSLPRLLSRGNEDTAAAITALRCAVGYLTALRGGRRNSIGGDGADPVLRAALPTFTEAICSALVFDAPTGLALITDRVGADADTGVLMGAAAAAATTAETYPIIINNCSVSNSVTRKQFKHLQDPIARGLLEQLLNLVGRYGDEVFVLPCLTQQLDTLAAAAAEGGKADVAQRISSCLFVINEVCKGVGQRRTSVETVCAGGSLFSSSQQHQSRLKRNLVRREKAAVVGVLRAYLQLGVLDTDANAALADADADTGISFRMENQIGSITAANTSSAVTSVSPFLSALSIPSGSPQLAINMRVGETGTEIASTAAAVTATSTSTSSSRLERVNACIMQQCLVLEGIAEAARCLQGDFKPLLMDTLYLVMQKLGDPNRAVHDTAWQTLNVIAWACGYCSVDEGVINPGSGDDSKLNNSNRNVASVKKLILDNVDYIMNDVCQRLRYPLQNPLAPHVLVASLEVAGIRLVEFMDDSMDEVFDTLDRVGWTLPEDTLFSLFRVMEKLVQVVSEEIKEVNLTRNLLAKVSIDGSDNASESGEPYSHEIAVLSQDGVSAGVRELCLKYQKSSVKRGEKGNAGGDDDDYEEDDEFPESVADFFRVHAEKRKAEDQENRDVEGDRQTADSTTFLLNEAHGVKDALPSSEDLSAQQQDKYNNEKEQGPVQLNRVEAMTKRILEKCQHFIAADNAVFSAFVLRVVRKSLPVLRDKQPDQHAMIHILWPIIMRRLSSPDHFVVMEALILVSAIARESGDFVKRRVMEDLFPRMERFLSGFHQSNKPQHQHQSRSSKKQMELAKRDVASTFSDSIRTKLVLAALDTLSSVLQYLPIFQSRELIRTLDMVWPFLDSAGKNSDKVIAAAKNLVNFVSAKDEDLVWLKVQVTLAANGSNTGPIHEPPSLSSSSFSSHFSLCRLRLPLFVASEPRVVLN